MRPRLILVGGGGHCASCIDVIEQEGKFEVFGIVDNNIAVRSLLGYSILGGDDCLAQLRASCDYLLVTVGQLKSAAVRSKLYDEGKSLGFQFPTVISPRAYVSKHAFIGEGTIIMHDALINTNAVVGNNCIINTKALVEHDAQVEDHCHISTSATINGGAVIRKGSFVGSNAVMRERVETREGDFIKAGTLFMGQSHE